MYFRQARNDMPRSWRLGDAPSVPSPGLLQVCGVDHVDRGDPDLAAEMLVEGAETMTRPGMWTQLGNRVASLLAAADAIGQRRFLHTIASVVPAGRARDAFKMTYGAPS